ASYRAYDEHHRGAMILLVAGCLVLALPSCYDKMHRGTIAVDFSC
ncbi:hypothetical protein A2U01_0080300, partial [Trifolium medium]|nr:hypothetical protein [Trifolium medium]